MSKFAKSRPTRHILTSEERLARLIARIEAGGPPMRKRRLPTAREYFALKSK